MSSMNGQISPNVKPCLNGKLDFSQIKNAALQQSDSLLPRWLPGGKFQGDEYVVKNPTRHDSKPGSFKINKVSGKWSDFATGNSGHDLISLKAFVQDLKLYDAAKSIAQELGMAPPTVPSTPGLTLEAYATAKHLPIPFLRSLGLETVRSPYGKGFPAVSIPYRDAQGALIRTRLRVALDGDTKLVWDQRKDKGVTLYGLERMSDSAATIYLVEGESDAHTLWSRGYPALGLPGATTFKPERDDDTLVGLEVIAFFEADEGGDGVVSRLKQSKHVAHIKIAKINGFKDVSELHMKAPERFDTVIEQATREAKPLADVKERKKLKKLTKDDRGGGSPSEILISLTKKTAEFFMAPDETAYACVKVDEHREVWDLRSRGFRQWLNFLYFSETGRVPKADAMTEALNTFDAIAQFYGGKHPVSTRSAAHGGKLYLDLCDENWRAIEIDADGWRIIERPPVYFTRAKGMQALPEPIHDASIDELRPLLNLEKEDDFKLVVAWLLSALRSQGPYPLLALCGEAGAAKSTTAKVLRSLVDPNIAPLRSMPRDERDLFISATNSACLVLDNLSSISAVMSDALCRVATGGSFSTRSLHTNGDESLFDVCRPVLLTSVGEVIARSDLADRAVIVTLASISENRRMADDEFSAMLDAARPRILGALLDAMVGGVRELPNVKLDRLPRMANFIKWTRACEVGLWEPGSIQAAFDANMADAVDGVLEGDPVAVALMSFLSKNEGYWKGKGSELLSQLAAWAPEGAIRERGWPRNPQTLTSRLRLAAPSLKKKSYVYASGKSNGERWIEVKKI